MIAPGATIVHVFTAEGVRRAALIRRRRLRGRDVVQVWLRGTLAPVTLDPHLVFDVEAEARKRWREAAAHQARMERAGAKIRVIDAHVSLALVEA